MLAAAMCRHVDGSLALQQGDAQYKHGSPPALIASERTVWSHACLPLCSWQGGQDALDDLKRWVGEICTLVALQVLLTRRHGRAAGVLLMCAPR